MKLGTAVRGVVSLAVVIVIFAIVLPRVADFGEVWRVLTEMTWLEAITLGLAAAWNLITYWILAALSLPGLTVAQAMIATESSTALANSVPGGPAFGMGVTYSMYSSWGFSRPSVALAVTVSGFADLFAKLAMPAAALVFLFAYGDDSPGLFLAAVVGGLFLTGLIAIAVMTLKSKRSARRAGELCGRAAAPVMRRLGRAPARLGDAFASFRTEALSLIATRGWWLLASALMSHISLYLVLLLALRHIGVPEAEVGWAEALGAFAFIRFLSAVPITPGGLGVVELGLAAALVYAGGPRAEVVAAVLVFRALTYLVQIPFGAITYAYWQHSARWKEERTTIDATAGSHSKSES